MNVQEINEKFDERFKQDHLRECGDPNDPDDFKCRCGLRFYKNFTKDTISSLLQSLIDRLEGEKKEIPRGYFAQPVRTPSHNHTFNEGISKAQELTRELLK